MYRSLSILVIGIAIIVAAVTVVLFVGWLYDRGEERKLEQPRIDIARAQLIAEHDRLLRKAAEAQMQGDLGLAEIYRQSADFIMNGPRT